MLPNNLDVVFVFVFGTLIGSFLNVCIARIPNDESVIHQPSRRPKCKAMIVAASTHFVVLLRFLIAVEMIYCSY
jgi:prepilin signal peptidase PulO-like enzyme (type II secretory pathway)